MAVDELLIGAVTVTSDPVRAAGEVAPLTVNEAGRVRVSTKPGSFPDSSAALSTAGQVLVVDVRDASNIVLHVKNTGSATMSAGTFVFEGSIDSTDGVTDGTWFSVQAVRSSANTIEVSAANLGLAAAAGNTYAWELSVNALKYFRIRTTVAPTASSIATWTAIRGTYATEPIPAVQAHAISGTTVVTPATGTNYGLVTAATTNLAAIKASAGNLFELTAFNGTAATIYVKLYNKASAPALASDVPLLTIPVAAGAFLSVPFGEIGKRFVTGIAIAVTGAAAATDTTAVAAGAQISATYI